MLKAIRFEILRDVVTNGRISLPLAEEPKRVVSLLDEAEFNKDQYLIHHRTCFFEDRGHDWNWSEGKFRFYTRIRERGDVIVIYEEAEVEPEKRFDPMTGEPLAGK